MARETKQIEIAGATYHVTQLPYFRAQRLFFRLLRVAGPMLTALVQLVGAGDAKAVASLLALDADKIAGALADVFGRVSPEEMESLTRDILATTQVDQGDKRLDVLNVLDLVIGGEFWAGLLLQAFALKVHFGNFNSARDAFSALGLTASPSAALNTSTDGKDAT